VVARQMTIAMIWSALMAGSLLTTEQMLSSV
jgi:hypothetical protein